MDNEIQKTPSPISVVLILILAACLVALGVVGIQEGSNNVFLVIIAGATFGVGSALSIAGIYLAVSFTVKRLEG